MRVTLGELADRFGLKLLGDGGTAIEGVCPLQPGRAGHLSFLANPRYRPQLAATAAAAVIVGEADTGGVRAGLAARDPYLAFARVAQLFAPADAPEPGIHASAVVARDASVATDAVVGAHAVIGPGARIGARVVLGPNVVVERDAEIGEATRIDGGAFVGARVRIGARCRINPGAAIGGRGFGLARGPQGWEEVPQLGSVTIGDDVEVGANTCIDRGAIDDTVIEDGVKLDNLVQIAHNVRIGAHTAIAACSGVAGSTRIGARCMIGGAAGVAGHLEIVDDVVIAARSMVLKSITEPGMYGSDMPAVAAAEWRKRVARVRRLGILEQRVAALERKLGLKRARGGEDGADDT